MRQGNEEKKGIKLDFKQLEAVEPSLTLLARLISSHPPDQLVPVWLNADILALPGSPSPVDPDRFLDLCQTYLPRYVFMFQFGKWILVRKTMKPRTTYRHGVLPIWHCCGSGSARIRNFLPITIRIRIHNNMTSGIQILILIRRAM